ncbi:uncharacterized protein B0I36DRAFT_338558 [Microdochium trichocladiopsis]|uniref:Uncharacterized protein n=1 Tax=Microdochium trichocladiopsis TaxID=1682393 RepID=A0A9P9BIG0_9PEZI|nr:uncharacterized protein B0I36DRAFT_338558 [Microdochium trichocladiopsis]KAH7014325.1 hypothetical protein B0I36DRAFT_338558 [Microdochium trichocladiopsis]
MAQHRQPKTAAPAPKDASSVVEPPQVRNTPSAPQSRGARVFNSLLVGVLWISTLSVAGCYLSSKQHTLSTVMQRIADFINDYIGLGDFNDIRIGSFKPSELQIIGTWLAFFWTSIALLVVRKQYSIVYILTPILLSFFLQYLGKFTLEEYFIVVVPFLLSVWELASD